MSRRIGPPPGLPGFEFVEPLGSGGFADVFKYTQLGLGREVAVKVLLSDLDPSMQASFEVEASVMAQLSNHPSIVSIHQAGVTPDGRPFLVMEYCPPPHLALRVRSRPLTVTKALEVAIQLCGAVETAHRLGVLHRDIKPANILFTAFGRAALTDFGISVTTASAESGEGVGMSVPWAPPEQLTVGAPMGPSGDVYALAATLWTTLVGRSPFHVQGGANDPVAMAQRVRTMPVPPTRRPDVPESLERAIRTAMAKAPTDRYDTALTFARALQVIQAELHLPQTTIDVLDDQVVEEAPAEDAGGTRVSGFVSIDPEPEARGATPPPPSAAPWPAQPSIPSPIPSSIPPSVPPPTHDTLAGSAFGPAPGFALPPAPEVGDTVRPDVPRPPTEEPASPASTKPPTPPTRRLGLLAATAVVVLLVVGGAVWFGTRAPDATDDGDAAPRTRPSAADPISDATPVPTRVKVRWSPERLTVSWANPAPEDGDTYEVFLVRDPNEASIDPERAVATAQRRVTLPSDGERCVTLRTIRASGASEPVLACDLETR